MLYVTTRDKFDAFTVHRAMGEDRAPNGGLYLPFRMPCLAADELSALREKSFGQCVAELLNGFFCAGLSGWDVEFSIGKNPVKLVSMNHRILIGELWHNQQWDYTHLERVLSERLCGRKQPSGWMRIAVRIAVLFGVYGEMLRIGSIEPKKEFDVALPTGDFSAAMAVWYARQMGLPVANIICACNENSALWDLMHLGEVRTDVTKIDTVTPLADHALPEELERLVFGTLGVAENLRFCEICGRGGVYTPRPGMLETLRKGMFSAVVSQARLEATIPSVYRTGGYILGPYTALAYGGLLDYRAKTGESRTALLLSDRSPVCDAAFVAGTMEISERELKAKLD